MSLSERHRPKIFEDVRGQPTTVAWCMEQAKQVPARSAIFCGGSGTGKTTIGRIFASSLLCEDRRPSGSPCLQCEACKAFTDGNPLNFQSFNCADMDTPAVSEVVQTMRANPIGADHRVFIFDEAHGLSQKGFDVLLTALERPRANVFIFLTTAREKIPKPIQDRCSVHELSMIDAPTAIRYLWSVCAAEGIEAEPEALDLIASIADGSARALLETLEAAVVDARVTVSYARKRFKLDFSEVVAAILVSALRGDLQQAIAALTNWPEMPSRKRELLHDCLVDVYCDVLGLRR